ncbi:thaumatin-like protein [Mycena amicta]|nr:thaumatin-like protein [Mycena amicta]
MQLSLRFLLPVVAAALVSARNFTVVNNCTYTIWPALFTDLHAGNAVPSQATGWVAPPSSSVSFEVPDNWAAGRIWGRTECDFSVNPGPNSCVTGGCNGGLLCDPNSGTGVPPATLAEFTLDGDGGTLDNLDVSIVDGFNIPITITNNVGCSIPSCPVDVDLDCPTPLQTKDSNGIVKGCLSACKANLDGNQQNSTNCCSGDFSLPQTCPSSGVEFYDFFKGSCPDSYAYAYDESSGTALWFCNSTLKADYTVTFCP